MFDDQLPPNPESDPAPPAVSADRRVLYLRWRPQRFEDLVGQSHIAQTISNAIKAGRVSQGYLFTGTRGIGKTSAARIFAKALPNSGP